MAQGNGGLKENEVAVVEGAIYLGNTFKVLVFHDTASRLAEPSGRFPVRERFGTLSVCHGLDRACQPCDFQTETLARDRVVHEI